MGRKLLSAFVATIVGLSGALLAYSIFFEVSFLTQQSVTSYFPWRWLDIYSNSTLVFELFLIGIAISSVVLFTSLVALVRLRGPSDELKKAWGNLPATNHGMQGAATAEPRILDMANDTSRSESVWTVDEDPQSVDGMLAELNRSRQRETALKEAIRAEKEHAEHVEEILGVKMKSKGYPISTPRSLTTTPPVAQPATAKEKPVEKKLSWRERRAAKKETEKEERRKKRLEEKNQMVSLEPESKEEEEDAAELGRPASVDQNPLNEPAAVEVKGTIQKKARRNGKDDLELQLKKETEEKDNLKKLADSLSGLTGETPLVEEEE